MWNRSRNSRRQGAGRSRRRRRGLHVLIPVLLVLSLLVPLVPVVQASGGSATPSTHQLSAPPAQFGDRRSEEDIFLPEEGFGEPLYQSVLEGWLREGIQPASPEFELVVRGADWTNISDPRHVQVGDASATNMMQRYADLWEQSQALTRQDPVRYPVNQNIRNLTTAYNQPEVAQTYQRLGDRSGPVALWVDDLGFIEWEVEVPQTALYNITTEYFPILGKRSSIQREIQVNGELPFREAKRIVQRRVWIEQRNFEDPDCAQHGGVCRDNQGNDIRPTQAESPRWETFTFEDADGRYQDPFMFKLNARQEHHPLDGSAGDRGH